MIQIERDFVLIEFKNGPAFNDGPSCIRLSMEILNLSKSFSSILKKGSIPGKKMEKTGRIRIGIQKFVNKTDVTPKIIDNLISIIRKGELKKINAKIELYPDNDVPAVIARLIMKRSI